VRKNQARLIPLVTLAIVCLGWSTARAQATRTWVSGVGDDANPCSRTAPCKTFAGAISKTAAGGEIDVLGPGGFGALTITKSISIESDGNLAGVLVSGTNGIVINAGPNDVVVLRGLTFEGLGTGLDGVSFIAGGALHVEHCTINHFTEKGIDFEPSGSSQLFVKDTIVRNNADATNGGGILIKPGSSGSAHASIDGARLEGNLFGVRVEDNGDLTVRNSVAADNAGDGFIAVSSAAPAQMNIDDSVAANNGVGVASQGAKAAVRINAVTVTGNGVGLSSSSKGKILSFRNNANSDNGTNGSPSSKLHLQ
jgi:Right handed beta helix region